MNRQTPEPPNKNASPKISRSDFNNTPEEIEKRRRLLEANRLAPRKLLRTRDIERRRYILKWAKWVLPASALVLLSSIAIWPEVDRAIHSNKAAIAQLEHLKVESGTMLYAVYRGLDAHLKPYMITADKAQQNTTDIIDLTNPIADTFSSQETWLMISAKHGIYVQSTQSLDLYQDVMLYRNDGVIMRGTTADIALKSDIIASDNWVHAEGPFGILDAQGYFIAQHDGLAQFRGPSRLVLNNEHIAPPPPAYALPVEGNIQ